MSDYGKGGGASFGQHASMPHLYYAMGCNNSVDYHNQLTQLERECLMTRQYWCFLLSSIVTFCVSMLLVVSWRIVVFLCCTAPSASTTPPPYQPTKEFDDLPISNSAADVRVQNGQLPGSKPSWPGDPASVSSVGQDALGAKNSFGNAFAAARVGWMTEAKDWAGELISGQSTTGRILVSGPNFLIAGLSLRLFYQYRPDNFLFLSTELLFSGNENPFETVIFSNVNGSNLRFLSEKRKASVSGYGLTTSRNVAIWRLKNYPLSKTNSKLRSWTSRWRG